ncbi:Aste57867_19255 [Aphanomyces stellatus]|uniref:Aste57867_19255 protein n=1 Tax=Aphanomyces stellatus TaxID=120398 RepID=A0A485LGD6_9STRA|nr:hypothetical protein As57867_019191 [Aphanomyces stellatus]VFT95975.1 Aste57867_19255 [Aphanomyces stellatus]
MACHWWPLPILILFVTGVGVGVSFFAKTGIFAKGTSSGSGSSKTLAPSTITSKNGTKITVAPVCISRNQYLKDGKCATCPGFKGDKTFSVFWESQADGCLDFVKSDMAKYVTHVYWGFAKIDPKSGAVDQSLQGNDETLSACIKAFQNLCIQNYVSVGGATERANFPQLTTPAQWTKFGETAATLVEKFNFTGVDIDDESGNLSGGGDWLKNLGPTTVGYLTALRSSLDALPRAAGVSKYKISWDEFPGSFDTTCSKTDADYGRCFNTKILPLVDQVNNMLYNDMTPQLTSWLNGIDATWGAKVGASKLVIGGCVGKSGSGVCGNYGDEPSTDLLTNYAKKGANYQGAMLWTASSDWSLYKGKTVAAMGNGGNYGVDW